MVIMVIKFEVFLMVHDTEVFLMVHDTVVVHVFHGYCGYQWLCMDFYDYRWLYVVMHGYCGY